MKNLNAESLNLIKHCCMNVYFLRLLNSTKWLFFSNFSVYFYQNLVVIVKRRRPLNGVQVIQSSMNRWKLRGSTWKKIFSKFCLVCVSDQHRWPSKTKFGNHCLGSQQRKTKWLHRYELGLISWLLTLKKFLI